MTNLIYKYFQILKAENKILNEKSALLDYMIEEKQKAAIKGGKSKKTDLTN